MEKRVHKKVLIFRPLYPVGGQELGYLPGSEGEKMSPWAQAVFDTLGALVSLLVTVADVSLFNIGSAFWGLVAGFVVSWLMERDDFKAQER